MGLRGIDGRTAIVTGAASGIGEATARRLAQEGARVVCVDRAEHVEEVADSLVGDAIAVVADVSIEADVERYMQAALERFHSVEMVFLNAGITGPFAPFFDVTTEQFDESSRSTCAASSSASAPPCASCASSVAPARSSRPPRWRGCAATRRSSPTSPPSTA
jgi:NADP-dependent 3-hydroxy acid dehydrogenase YdfG